MSLDRRKFLKVSIAAGIMAAARKAGAQALPESAYSLPPSEDRVKRAREGIHALEGRVDAVITRYRKVTKEILALLCSQPEIKEIPSKMTPKQKEYSDAHLNWGDILPKPPDLAAGHLDNYEVTIYYEWFGAHIEHWEKSAEILERMLEHLKSDEQFRKEIGKVERERECRATS